MKYTSFHKTYRKRFHAMTKSDSCRAKHERTGNALRTSTNALMEFNPAHIGVRRRLICTNNGKATIQIKAIPAAEYKTTAFSLSFKARASTICTACQWGFVGALQLIQ